MAKWRGLPVAPIDIDAIVTLSLIPFVLFSVAVFSVARLCCRYPVSNAREFAAVNRE